MLRATPSITTKFVKSLRAHGNDPVDQIGQTRLLMSFGLADVIQSINGRNSSMENPNLATDMVHTLASKVLHIPLFAVMEWSSPDIQPAKVFHLVGKILEEKTSLFSLVVAQTTADFPAIEEAAKWRARFTTEAIASSDVYTSYDRGLTTFYDSPKSAGVTYWIRPNWSARDGRKELINVAFAAATTIVLLYMVFGCNAIVDTLPHGSALLEELLAFMRNFRNQRDMASKGALVRYPKDPLPP